MQIPASQIGPIPTTRICLEPIGYQSICFAYVSLAQFLSFSYSPEYVSLTLSPRDTMCNAVLRTAPWVERAAFYS